MRVCVICSVVFDAWGRNVRTECHSRSSGQCDGQNPSSLTVSDEEWKGAQMVRGAKQGVSLTLLIYLRERWTD